MLATERCLMTKQRRTFSPEFKREAACLVLDQGYSHAEAARSLGLVESALRRWVNQLQQERGGITQIRSGVATSPTFGRRVNGTIWRLSSISMRGAWWAGLCQKDRMQIWSSGRWT